MSAIKNIHIAIMNGDLYPALDMITQGHIAIGGSTALVAHGELPDSYKPGDVDYCVDEASIPAITEFMLGLGYHITIDISGGAAFTVRLQFMKDKDKQDFFIIPRLREWSTEINGVRYVKSAVIWSARGYYVGVGSAKAQSQLVENGMIRPFAPNSVPVYKLTRKQVIRRIIGDVKHIIKSIVWKV
jgi:hypothetical protein